MAQEVQMKDQTRCRGEFPFSWLRHPNHIYFKTLIDDQNGIKHIQCTQ